MINIKALFSAWWARRDLLNPIKTVGYELKKSNSTPIFSHEQKGILSKFPIASLALFTLTGCATTSAPTPSQPRAAIDKDLLESIGPVRIQFVRNGHWGVFGGVPAKALRTNTDPVQRWVLINMDTDLTDLDMLIMHELAHHVAWNEHGENIRVHGPEFKAACRKLVTRRVNHFCGGE